MSDAYKDPRWQRVRLEVMERDGWACVACLDKTSTLHVHHKDYHGELWDTPLDMLQTLCESCHAALGKHPKGGIYWVRSGDVNPFVVVRHCPSCRHDCFEVEGQAFIESLGGRFDRLCCASTSCDWWYPLVFETMFRTWEYHDGKPKDG